MLLFIRRLAAFGCGGVLLAALATGCSGDPACQPEVHAGTTYKVTLGAPTTKSDPRCVVAQFQDVTTYQVVAANTRPSAIDPNCQSTPATAAPPVNQPTIESCIPKDSGMLGVTCQILYRGGCHGTMSFYYVSANGAALDWNAARIDNAVLRIEDSADNCIADYSDCLNEYAVVLERG